MRIRVPSYMGAIGTIRADVVRLSTNSPSYTIRSILAIALACFLAIRSGQDVRRRLETHRDRGSFERATTAVSRRGSRSAKVADGLADLGGRGLPAQVGGSGRRP